MPRRSRTVSLDSPEPATDAGVDILLAAPGDHVYERLKLIVVMLEYAEGEARALGREETMQKSAAALKSARRDLALHTVSGYARDH